MNDSFSQIALTRYRSYKLELMRQGCRSLVLLALALFPAFGFLDYYAHEEQYLVLWAVRFSTTFLYLVIYILLSLGKLQQRPYLTSLMVIATAAISITMMCLVLSGYPSPYYAGINLVILAAVLVMPVDGQRMGLIVFMILTIYIFGILFEAGWRIDNPQALVNNLYFLFATGIIGITAAYLTERLRKESFYRLVELERIQADLKLQDEIKSKFFANVSHELRTPLNLILGPIKSILKKAEFSSDIRSSLEVAERNAEALLRQVSNLLDVSRLDAGASTLEYVQVDLAQFSRSIFAQFQLLAQQRKINFQVVTPPQLIAQIDSIKLERVITNLLSNAFKFTPDGGTIIARLEQEEHNFVLKISDSGPGIAPEQRESVFQRFYQAAASDTRKAGGSGLGLAIAKEFTLLHLGEISVASASTGGAEIIVKIPLKAPHGSTVKELHAMISKRILDLNRPVTKMADASQLLPGKRAPLILIVEDNFDMSDYIKSILQEKYVVATAFNGHEGLKKAIELAPDIILTDVMMPDRSGIELLEDLRSDERFESVPVIILTAKADDELRVRLLQQGAQDYILKPFVADELEARISIQLSIKRTRELLQNELTSKENNIESLVQQISERQKELERSIEQVGRARDEAEKALELREDFISMASHELNTPLTAMQLQTQVAKRKALTPAGAAEFYPKLVASYESQLKRLIRLVSDMLDISRIRTGKFSLECVPVELGSIIEQVVERLPDNSRSLISLQIDEQVEGYWDTFRIEQAILNLLTNAIKYGNGKPVQVKLSLQEESAKLQVIDQGIGIASEKKLIVFERFERAVSAQEFSGLGLGLYITKQIVEAHSGSISLESAIGQGSTFTIMLPQRPEC